MRGVKQTSIIPHMMLNAKLIYIHIGKIMSGRRLIATSLPRTVARFENSRLKEGTYPSAFSSRSSSVTDEDSEFTPGPSSGGYGASAGGG